MDGKAAKKSFDYNYLSVIMIYLWSFAFLIGIPSIEDPESRLFPYILTGFAILLGTILLIKTRFKLGKKEELLDFSGSGKAFTMILALIIYTVAIEAAGFYLATPFYLYITMWILGQKNKKLMVTISLLTALGIYLFFQLLLDMRIPEGALVPWLMDRI